MTEPSKQPWGKDRRGNQDQSLLEAPGKLLHIIYRTFTIATEFFMGAHAFRNEAPCVTVFGSARFEEDHEYYKLAQAVGKALAEAGFTVMTGGGPGIMEAANRGAKDGGGRSLGCNILLPKEQHHNPYLDKWITFKHFFIRKVIMMKYSCAFVVLPGGYGTLDEAFETATLIQTNTIKQFPIVTMGRPFWDELDDFIEKGLLEYKTISPGDEHIFYSTESPNEAVAYIQQMTTKRNLIG